jgi:hypothetical protein
VGCSWAPRGDETNGGEAHLPAPAALQHPVIEVAPLLNVIFTCSLWQGMTNKRHGGPSST